MHNGTQLTVLSTSRTWILADLFTDLDSCLRIVHRDPRRVREDACSVMWIKICGCGADNHMVFKWQFSMNALHGNKVSDMVEMMQMRCGHALDNRNFCGCEVDVD